MTTQQPRDNLLDWLRDAHAMADWLLEHLPEVTQAFLARSANPDIEAKR